MTQDYDRAAARDSAIRALLPLVPTQGWTLAALSAAAGPAAELLFPGGPAELVAAYIDLADRDMAQLAAPSLLGQKLSARVRTLILTRLAQAEPHKHAVRRALAVLTRPGNAILAARCTAGTVDAIWHAAGDTSADFSWYTKRAILASVYTATLLWWLGGDRSPEDIAAFVDRRLAGVARLAKLRARITPKRAA